MCRMGGRFLYMLHDDIQNVDRRVDKMFDAIKLLQAVVHELTAQVSDILKRLDARDAEQPKPVSKKSGNKD